MILDTRDSRETVKDAKAPAKAGKNQFKCFHCRLIFANKDGEWYNWEQMQVHLCRACDKLTKAKPQRNHRSR